MKPPLFRKAVLAAAILLAATTAAFAQSPRDNRQVPLGLAVGGEFSIAHIDANVHPTEYGIGAWTDFDFLPFLGLEAEGRTVSFHEQNHLRQDTLLFGARYFRHDGRLEPYAKLLTGVGSADFPAGTLASNPSQQHDTMTVQALGGGLDDHLHGPLAARADFEYQFWHGYGRGLIEGGRGMSNPWIVSFGLSWRIF
jgi:hypothetical protein